MAEIATSSIDIRIPDSTPVISEQIILLDGILFLVSAFVNNERIPRFIITKSIKADLSLSDTQIGLLIGIAFAVCYALLSLPLARASDRGSPRLVLASCIVIGSAMTGFALGGALGDTLGWQTVLIGAGAIGGLTGFFALAPSARRSSTTMSVRPR